MSDKILADVLFFTIGIMVGYVVRFIQDYTSKHDHITIKRMKRKKKEPTTISTSSVVFVLIATAVVISVVAEIFVPTYHTNPLLYGALGTIAGLFFRGMNGKV